MRLLPVLLCLIASMSATVRAEVVTLHPVRDNTLFQDPDGVTSNGAGPALFAGNNGQGLTRRTLLAFDVVGGVPSGATIDSVVVALQVSNAPNTIPREFTLHRVLADWGEGTSYATGGTGAPAAEGDATWTHAFLPARTWSTAGGDFDPDVSATLQLTDVGSYSWRGAGLAADLRAWRSNPASNHGWLLRGEETGFNTARRFESREAAEPADRPALTIHYTLVRQVRPLAWGAVKSRYRRGGP